MEIPRVCMEAGRKYYLVRGLADARRFEVILVYDPDPAPLVDAVVLAPECAAGAGAGGVHKSPLGDKNVWIGSLYRLARVYGVNGPAPLVAKMDG